MLPHNHTFNQNKSDRCVFERFCSTNKPLTVIFIIKSKFEVYHWILRQVFCDV